MLLKSHKINCKTSSFTTVVVLQKIYSSFAVEDITGSRRCTVEKVKSRVPLTFISTMKGFPCLFHTAKQNVFQKNIQQVCEYIQNCKAITCCECCNIISIQTNCASFLGRNILNHLSNKSLKFIPGKARKYGNEMKQECILLVLLLQSYLDRHH